MRVTTILFGTVFAAHLAGAPCRVSYPQFGFAVVFDVDVGGSTTCVSLNTPINLGAGVRFKYTGVTNGILARPTPPNFVVVSPPSGTSSVTTVLIGLNQTIVQSMSPGDYFLNVNFSALDPSPVSQTSVLVVLRLSQPPPPTITSVVNTATYQAALSPGALVSIFGANFGPPIGSTQYDDTGTYPASLPDGMAAFGSTTVTFNGIPAPIVYLSLNQINAIVPYGIAGHKSADVVVTCYTRSTPAFVVAIMDTSPGVFTIAQNGSGQASILNVPRINPNDLSAYTYNSVDNPAPKGSVITLFATGVGAWDPPVPDGTISLLSTNSRCSDPGSPQCRRLAASASLTIGGKPSAILYAGSAPYEPWAVLQVNARVPIDADSGVQPIVLTIGQNDNSQQKVTIAVQ